MVRIGVDVGGTFTDFTIAGAASGENLYFKVPSTPSDPSVAIIDGLRQILAMFAIAPGSVSYIGHGTTVATNALLERRGVRTLLAITSGFGDALRIGYQNRPRLFDRHIVLPELLYERVLEVDERLSAQGEALPAIGL